MCDLYMWTLSRRCSIATDASSTRKVFDSLFILLCSNSRNLDEGGVLKAFEALSGLERLLVDPCESMDVVGESASEGEDFENANEQFDACVPVGEGVTGLSISMILPC